MVNLWQVHAGGTVHYIHSPSIAQADPVGPKVLKTVEFVKDDSSTPI